MASIWAWQCHFEVELASREFLYCYQLKENCNHLGFWWVSSRTSRVLIKHPSSKFEIYIFISLVLYVGLDYHTKFMSCKYWLQSLFKISCKKTQYPKYEMMLNLEIIMLLSSFNFIILSKSYVTGLGVTNM